MIAPYLLMVVFFLSMAFLGALDAAFTSAGWLTWFNGLPWLRVRFITIGVLLEMTFAILPILRDRWRILADHAQRHAPSHKPV